MKKLLKISAILAVAATFGIHTPVIARPPSCESWMNGCRLYAEYLPSWEMTVWGEVCFDSNGDLYVSGGGFIGGNEVPAICGA